MQQILNVKASWLTHVPWADRESLGLTSHTLNCDRMAYLFRVVDPIQVGPWSMVRSSFDIEAVHALEAARGTRPDYWWLTGVAQRVELLEGP